VFGDMLFVPGLLKEPFPGGVGVGQGLLSGEGLGGDQKQGGGRLTGAQGLRQVGGINVGDEVELKIPPGVGLERFRDHDRAEVGPADPEIHDMGDGLSGVPLPFTRAHLFGKGLHLLPDLFHFRHHVLAVHLQGLVGGPP